MRWPKATPVILLVAHQTCRMSAFSDLVRTYPPPIATISWLIFFFQLFTALCCAHAHTHGHVHLHAYAAQIEFPERPGALRKFLSSLRNMGWNISLFHYRNHGAGSHIFIPVPAIWVLITVYYYPSFGEMARSWQGSSRHPGARRRFDTIQRVPTGLGIPICRRDPECCL